MRGLLGSDDGRKGVITTNTNTHDDTVMKQSVITQDESRKSWLLTARR